MTDAISSDDLTLVLAVASQGSVGAAARHLRITQPAASERLARLERRSGLRLFDRDTRGARATPAGVELAAQAEHILGHLTSAIERARVATETRALRVGSITSLAEVVLPALDLALMPETDGSEAPGPFVEQVVDHGPRLLEWLAEGTLDAAVLAIARQVDLPSSLRVHRVGTDVLALFVPHGVPGPGPGRRSLLGRHVVFATWDGRQAPIGEHLVSLGARAQRVETPGVALAIARARGVPALVPRSASLAAAVSDGRTVSLSWRHRLAVDLVVPRTVDPRLVAAVGPMGEVMRLETTAAVG